MVKLKRHEKTLQKQMDNALRSHDFENAEYYMDKIIRLNYIQRVNKKQLRSGIGAEVH